VLGKWVLRYALLKGMWYALHGYPRLPQSLMPRMNMILKDVYLEEVRAYLHTPFPFLGDEDVIPST
jgi:hypothetical protein